MEYLLAHNQHRECFWCKGSGKQTLAGDSGGAGGALCSHCEGNGRITYLLFVDKEGALNEHKEQAQKFLSNSNAIFFRDKWQRKHSRVGDKRRLYLYPLRQEVP